MSIRKGWSGAIFWISAGAAGILLFTIAARSMNKPAVSGYAFYMAFCGAGLAWGLAADFLNNASQFFSRRCSFPRISIRDAYVASLGFLVLALYGIGASSIDTCVTNNRMENIFVQPLTAFCGDTGPKAASGHLLGTPEAGGRLLPPLMDERKAGQAAPAPLEVPSAGISESGPDAEEVRGAELKEDRAPLQPEQASVPKNMFMNGTAGRGRLVVASTEVLKDGSVLMVLTLSGRAGGARMFRPKNTDALCFDILGKWDLLKVYDASFGKGCLARLRAAYHPDRLRVAGISRRRSEALSGRVEFAPDESKVRIYFEKQSD